MQATGGEVQDMEREKDPRVAGEGEKAGEDEENSLASSRAEAWERVDQAIPEEGGWEPMEGGKGGEDMCRCDQGSRLPPQHSKLKPEAWRRLSDANSQAQPGRWTGR